MTTEASKRAVKKYRSEKTYQVAVRFTYVNEGDIINKLKDTKNKKEYLKELIRRDLGEER